MSENTNEAVVVKASKTKLTPVFKMVKEAIEIYKNNFSKFLLMILCSFLVGIAMLVLFPLGLFIAGLHSIVLSIILGVISIAVIVLAIYFSLRLKMGQLLIIKYPEESFREVYKRTSGLVMKYLALSLLLGLITLGLTLLFLIPGLIFGVFFSLAIFAFLFEDYEGYSALKRSKELVKDYWWAVFGRSLFLGLIIFALQMIISLPMEYLGENSVASGIYGFFTGIVVSIISPIFLAYSYIIFRDLKKLKGESKIEKKKANNGLILGVSMVIIVLLVCTFLALFLSVIKKSLEAKGINSFNSTSNLEYPGSLENESQSFGEQFDWSSLTPEQKQELEKILNAQGINPASNSAVNSEDPSILENTNTDNYFEDYTNTSNVEEIK